jgi:hypothetical protein
MPGVHEQHLIELHKPFAFFCGFLGLGMIPRPRGNAPPYADAERGE